VCACILGLNGRCGSLVRGSHPGITHTAVHLIMPSYHCIGPKGVEKTTNQSAPLFHCFCCNHSMLWHAWHQSKSKTFLCVRGHSKGSANAPRVVLQAVFYTLEDWCPTLQLCVHTNRVTTPCIPRVC